MDLLFGLDMLKAHQACIDLEKNVLRIQGREVKFLAEHELPDKARIFEGVEEPSAENPQVVSPNPQASGSQQHFPGSGHTLGSSPAPAAASSAPTGHAPSATHSEEAITTLMNLGVSREDAIRTLDIAGGNVEMAASLLF